MNVLGRTDGQNGFATSLTYINVETSMYYDESIISFGGKIFVRTELLLWL